jgi:hypothetical protein
MNYIVHISAQNGYQSRDVRIEGVNTQAKAKEIVTAQNPGCKITSCRSAN